MKNALTFAAVAEVATGLVLLIAPSLVGQVMLDQQLAGVATPVARVAGIALIALGISYWPATPLIGMLTYSAAICTSTEALINHFKLQIEKLRRQLDAGSKFIAWLAKLP